MTFFLFFKQIVDMLYNLKWLDGIMVLLVLVMLVYQYHLTRPDIKKMICSADIIVATLIILFTISFLKDVTQYLTYIKVLSAFLIYFLGRMYYERILECSEALSSAAYLIIGLNFLHRVFTYKTSFFSVQNANGDFYSCDTEMAFAMVLGFIFIGMFARKSIKKIITMLIICPLMIINSDAGIQTILFAVILFVMLMYVIEIALQKKRLAMIGLSLIITGLLIVVFLVHMPLITSDSNQIWVVLGNNHLLSAAHMDSRISEWKAIFDSKRPNSILEILFGLNLTTSAPLNSMYLKTYYSMGLTGILLTLALIIRTFLAANKGDDRKSFYLTVMTAILVLGSGVATNSMERLQMSWFIMLFTGMVISASVYNPQ